MDGRTSVPYLKSHRKRAFTLIETVLVVVIMTILVTVVVTAFGSYLNFYRANRDDTATSRKARDVFNVLEPAILNAGIGVPPTNPGSYFSDDAPVRAWASPIVISSDAANGKDELRVLYAVPTGFKNGGVPVGDFSSDGNDTNLTDVQGVQMKLIGSQSDILPGALNYMPESGYAADRITSYITFPGAYMRPLRITTYNKASKILTLAGKKSNAITRSEDRMPFRRSYVHAYHDVYLVRAAVAYVDSKNVFNFLSLYDLDGNDFSTNIYSGGKLSGFRIEGIRAIRFEKASDNSSVTVRLLAEGDAPNSQSLENTKTLAASWGITLDTSRHYEEFTRTWRTRNIE